MYTNPKRKRGLRASLAYASGWHGKEHAKVTKGTQIRSIRQRLALRFRGKGQGCQAQQKDGEDMVMPA